MSVVHHADGDASAGEVIEQPLIEAAGCRGVLTESAVAEGFDQFTLLAGVDH